MADEIQIQMMLQINNGFQVRLDRPGAFTADMTGVSGPVPGSLRISKYGTDVDLSQLVYLGGMCQMTNVSPEPAAGEPETYVMVGIYDSDAGIATFRPFSEIWPGETYINRLSRMIGQEVGTGSGTATVEASGLKLRLKAVGAVQIVKVEAFDK